MPAPIKPSNIVALSRGVILRPKPGGGFSDDYELRNYKPGDPIKNIHWKLSAKFDSIIIREPLVPPPHSRLIQVMKWDNSQQRDLILGRLRWISDFMLKWELPYYIKLGNDGPIAEITERDDLHNYLIRVLDGRGHTLPAPDPMPLRFTWVFHVDAEEKTSTNQDTSTSSGYIPEQIQI